MNSAEATWKSGEPGMEELALSPGTYKTPYDVMAVSDANDLGKPYNQRVSVETTRGPDQGIKFFVKQVTGYGGRITFEVHKRVKRAGVWTDEGAIKRFTGPVAEEHAHMFAEAAAKHPPLTGEHQIFVLPMTEPMRRALLKGKVPLFPNVMLKGGPDRSRLPSWYYSPLSESIASWQPQGTVDQLLAHLTKTRGARAEATDVGMLDWLKIRSRVTRDEALDFFTRNQIQLHEIRRGEGGTLPAEYEHDKFNVPGKVGYREILLTTPNYTGTFISPDGLAKRDAVFQRYRPELDAIEAQFQERFAGGGSMTRAAYDALQRDRAVLEARMEAEADAAYRLPAPLSWQHEIHFKRDKNIVAHLRITIRVLPDGRRVFFAEEVQGDIHQQGQAAGYRVGPAYAVRKNAEGRLEVYATGSGEVQLETTNERRATSAAEEMNLAIASGEETDERAENAPFKGDRWKSLALRRLIALAAEEGLDGVAWTVGQTQADRYDLSQYFKTISYHIADRELVAYDMQGREGARHSVDPTVDALEPYIGRELGMALVTKIQAAQPVDPMRWRVARTAGGRWAIVDASGTPVQTPALGGFRNPDEATLKQDLEYFRRHPEAAQPHPTLRGEELRVKPSWPYVFYDHKLVALAKEVGKSYGLTVAKTQVTAPPEAWTPRLATDAAQRWIRQPVDAWVVEVPDVARAAILRSKFPLYNVQARDRIGAEEANGPSVYPNRDAEAPVAGAESEVDLAAGGGDRAPGGRASVSVPGVRTEPGTPDRYRAAAIAWRVSGQFPVGTTFRAHPAGIDIISPAGQMIPVTAKPASFFLGFDDPEPDIAEAYWTSFWAELVTHNVTRYRVGGQAYSIPRTLQRFRSLEPSHQQAITDMIEIGGFYDGDGDEITLNEAVLLHYDNALHEYGHSGVRRMAAWEQFVHGVETADKEELKLRTGWMPPPSVHDRAHPSVARPLVRPQVTLRDLVTRIRLGKRNANLRGQTGRRP
jgi:hypothetical protein